MQTTAVAVTTVVVTTAVVTTAVVTTAVAKNKTRQTLFKGCKANVLHPFLLPQRVGCTVTTVGSTEKILRACSRTSAAFNFR